MIFLCCSTVPEYMPSPHVSPVSSSSLRVSWETPQDKDVRGEVTEYRVNLHQEQMSNPYAPRIVTQVSISAHSTFFLYFFWWKRATASIFWCVVGTQLWSFSGYIVLYFALSITQNTSCCSSFSIFSPSFIDMCCCIDRKLHDSIEMTKHGSNLHFCPVLYFHSLCLVSQYAYGVGWTVQKGLLYYSCESLWVFFFVRVANL